MLHINFLNNISVKREVSLTTSNDYNTSYYKKVTSVKFSLNIVKLRLTKCNVQ